MKIITDQRAAQFVADACGCSFLPPYTCIGLMKPNSDEISVAVVFNCFDAKDIHVTVAGSGWSRPFIRFVGEYVFKQLGCERITVTTSQQDVVDLALRLGGQVEGRLRNYYGRGQDALLVGILADDYLVR